VAVFLWALAGHALFIDPGLHDVEGRLINQCGVASLEDLGIRRATLVDQLAGVVGVAEHALPGGNANLAGRVALGGQAAQPEAE